MKTLEELYELRDCLKEANCYRPDPRIEHSIDMVTRYILERRKELNYNEEQFEISEQHKKLEKLISGIGKRF